jgi:16S rRNA (cytosine967-C5)-methyltransferase
VERDPGRCARLAATLARVGRTVALHCADASEPDAWWDGAPFDRILIDAPCSATGVIRRHPEIRVLRRQADIAPAVALQARLLDALWPMLAPGGRLVYATCSVLRDENDRQIAAFRTRSASAQSRDIVPGWFGLALPEGRQNLPGQADMDGFYYAVLEKPA